MFIEAQPGSQAGLRKSAQPLTFTLDIEKDMNIKGQGIRRVLLEVIAEYSGRDSSFQSGVVLGEAQNRLNIRNDIEMEQAL